MNKFKAKEKLRNVYDRVADGMINGNISINYRYQVQAELDKMVLDDYMKECGVTDPSDIDWSNPVIAVAHLLHDPLFRHYIMHGSKSQKEIVYNLMTDEMKEIYWNYEDEHGSKFCDLESVGARKRCKRIYKKEKHTK